MARFASNTGYAWDFIEGLYAELADRVAPAGVETWVAYPRVEGFPTPLSGSAARPVELAVELGRPGPLLRLVRFVRAHRVRTVYLADLPAWHPSYLILRLAGVRWVVCHDHSSGERPRPRGVRRVLKGLTRRLPWTVADRAVAVSDFVARRKVEVDLLPPERVVRIWNSTTVPEDPDGDARTFRADFDVPEGRPLVMCVGRAARQKGLDHLFRAFERLLAEWPEGRPRPLLVYMGEGPHLARLTALRDGLACRDDVRMLGYVEGASRYLAAATCCVVPSTWAEAFGLAALEPMARGVPVIASKVGGLPEVVVDGETGLLVPPGDEAALAAAMRTLLEDDALCERFGTRGRARVQAHFGHEATLNALAAVVAPWLAARS